MSTNIQTVVCNGTAVDTIICNGTTVMKPAEWSSYTNYSGLISAFFISTDGFSLSNPFGSTTTGFTYRPYDGPPQYLCLGFNLSVRSLFDGIGAGYTSWRLCGEVSTNVANTPNFSSFTVTLPADFFTRDTYVYTRISPALTLEYCTFRNLVLQGTTGTYWDTVLSIGTTNSFYKTVTMDSNGWFQYATYQSAASNIYI